MLAHFSDLDTWNFFGLDSLVSLDVDFCVAFLRSWIGFRRIRIRRILLDLDFVRC
jgi:hypothetical protein